MSTMWMSLAPCATNRSAMRSGRSVGEPSPVAAPGQWTRRERPFSTSMDGTTSTRALAVRRNAGRFCVQQPALEADRQRAVSQQRVVEALEAEVAAQPTLFVGSELEQQDLAQ